MFRLSILLPALLAAGCSEEPAEAETVSTTGLASTGSPDASSATTDADESTGSSLDDSSGTAPTTGDASTSSETGDSSGDCVPAVFGDALFDNACFL